MTNTQDLQFSNIIKETLDKTTELNFNDLKGHNIIFVIDMVNGFANQGLLASNNIANIIKPIKKLITKAIIAKIKIIAFNDSHNKHSPEFATYPTHCLENSEEAKLVPELNFPEIKIIKKNSTNGFFAFDFKPNLQWDNIVIVGCCTDICIYQMALSCKTWFNQHNKKVNIIVPINMTDTFDNCDHPSTIFKNMALYSMIKNGIQIVKKIT